MTHIACFFHLSVLVLFVSRTSSTSLLPSPNHQSLNSTRDTKTFRPTRRSQTTPRQNNSRPAPLHQHKKTRFSNITLFHRIALSPPSYTNLRQRLQHLTKTLHRCAIMSDLCYNCSTCHLTAGPCLRDLVQCEICYSWGHIYIFCPRSVTIKDRSYRYWGKCRMCPPKRLWRYCAN